MPHCCSLECKSVLVFRQHGPIIEDHPYAALIPLVASRSFFHHQYIIEGAGRRSERLIHGNVLGAVHSHTRCNFLLVCLTCSRMRRHNDAWLVLACACSPCAAVSYNLTASVFVYVLSIVANRAVRCLNEEVTCDLA